MSNELKEKYVRAMDGNKIALGYCEAYYLLRNACKLGYTCGVYGWNMDVYLCGDNVITTGYRRMIGKRPNTKVTEKYEKMACEIAENWSIPYDESEKKITELRNQWLSEIA